MAGSRFGSSSAMGRGPVPVGLLIYSFICVSLQVFSSTADRQIKLPPPLHRDREVPKKVAAVGDSITAGYDAEHWPEGVWPAQLQRLLGSAYQVQNFSNWGTTVQHEGTNCNPLGPEAKDFWSTKEFEDAIHWSPDIAILWLGINDGKNCNWDERRFAKAFREFVGAFAALPSKPRIFVIVPTPIYAPDGVFGGMNRTVINGLIPWAMRDEAAGRLSPSAQRVGPPVLDMRGLSGLIDAFDAFAEHCPEMDAPCDWMAPDGVHPNDEGHFQIAQMVQTAVSDLIAHGR